MSYSDVFVVPVPNDRLDEYRKLARKCAAIWLEHGALHYNEGVAEDAPHGKTTDFYRAVKATEGETVVVGFALYRSRKHRDQVLKKVFADPRFVNHPEPQPFDRQRIFAGGFAALVDKRAEAG